MSGFKNMVQADIKNVFLNDSEFAELHTVIYDGVTYKDIPIVMSGIKKKTDSSWYGIMFKACIL